MLKEIYDKADLEVLARCRNSFMKRENHTYEKENVVKLSMMERILVVLGWIGLVAMLLTVVIVIGTVVIATLLDWEFGASLLLVSILVVLGGIAGGYYRYTILSFLRQYSPMLPPKFVRCSYCGMKNYGTALFCIRCGKVLPTSRKKAKMLTNP